MNSEQRRLSDCCASFHEYVQKWKKLNATGVRVANELIHLKLRTDDGDNSESWPWGSLSRMRDLPMRLLAKLLKEVEKKYEELKGVLEDLRELHLKMGLVSSNARALGELVWITIGEEAARKPMFHTLTACQFSTRFEQLYDMYTHELGVKETIVDSILSEKDRDTLTLHVLAWLHEPYIDESAAVLLESMLLETGLRES